MADVKKFEKVLRSLINTKNIPAEYANRRKDPEIVLLVDGGPIYRDGRHYADQRGINSMITEYIDNYVRKKPTGRNFAQQIKQDMFRPLMALMKILENETLYHILAELGEEISVMVVRALAVGAATTVLANELGPASVVIGATAAVGSALYQAFDLISDQIEAAISDEENRALMDHYFPSTGKLSNIYRTRKKREELFGPAPKWGRRTGKVYDWRYYHKKAVADTASKAMKGVANVVRKVPGGVPGDETPTRVAPSPKEIEEMTTVKENKILKEYILKNTHEKFEETPLGQIVVDEINKAVAEIPEIKLALDYLAEQEDANLEARTRELGRSYATAALNKTKEEMIERLPEMIEQILSDIMSEMGEVG